MDKITFENLSIELTRRCNMKCRHCLRGEAQEVDIDHKYIDSLLDQTELIGSLYLTGGEPTLNLDAMEYIVDGLCKRGIPLLNFSISINGLIYSERFIEIIKSFKRIIDISRSRCLSDGNKYQPQEEISRCQIGVSLDDHHDQHDFCIENYTKYKGALFGYADVVRIIQGNRVMKVGRATSLLTPTVDINFDYELSQQQRVELLSKYHTPVCKHNKYHMFYENQKIVCCQLCMDAYGMICNHGGLQWDWERCDKYAKICNANDSIWAAIQEYNVGRISCKEYRDLRQAAAESPLTNYYEQIIDQSYIMNTQNELSYYQKKQVIKEVKNSKELKQLHQLTNIFSEGVNLLTNPAKWLSAISALQTSQTRQQSRISREAKIKELEQKAAELERRRKEIMP